MGMGIVNQTQVFWESGHMFLTTALYPWKDNLKTLNTPLCVGTTACAPFYVTDSSHNFFQGPLRKLGRWDKLLVFPWPDLYKEEGDDQWKLSPFLPLHSGSHGTRYKPILSRIDKEIWHSGQEVLSQIHNRSPRVASALC